jgi:DNA-3-methyladenine glycosylase II
VAVVPVRVPYRLDLSAVVLRRLSSNVVDVFDGGVYRRLLGDPRQPTLLSVAQHAPDAVTVRFDGPAAERFDPATVVQRALGTDVDLSAFYRGVQYVPWLERIAEGALGVKPPRYPSLWEAVVNAVVYQQVSIHAAGAILRRVIERYGVPCEIDDVRLYPFPTARTLLDADPLELRDLGLSINKITSLKAVAAALEDRSLDEETLTLLETPDLLEALVEHKGIGPWTAAVIALRGFGRLDVFPMNDSGAAALLRKLSGDPAVQPEPVIAALVPQQGMLYYHLLIGRLVERGEVAL